MMTAAPGSLERFVIIADVHCTYSKKIATVHDQSFLKRESTSYCK